MSTTLFSDHPRPGTGLLITMMLFLVGFLAALPAVLLAEVQLVFRMLVSVFLVICILVLIYAFWLLHNTKYEIEHDGIRVVYGRSVNLYPWCDFEGASHRPGFFTLKIGWLRVTPCVRLVNAVALKRAKFQFPLFLTPTDPVGFLNEIRHVAPRLFG